MKDLTKNLLAYIKENNIEISAIPNFMEDLKASLVSELLEDDGEYVIKRSYKLQKFDLEKIGRSIDRAATSINKPLNKSDLDLILKDFVKEIKNLDRRVYTTAEIRQIIGDNLVKEGYSDVAESYLKNRVY